MPVRRVIVAAPQPNQRRGTAFRVIGCKWVCDARRSSRISTGFVFERKLARQSCGVEMSPTGISCRRRHSAIASRYRRPTLSRQSTPQAAATSAPLASLRPKAVTNIPIAIHWSVASNRVSLLRPDHRHSSISIGRDPRSAASFNQASVQSRVPAALRRLCPDAGSRRTLNHSDEVAR